MGFLKPFSFKILKTGFAPVFCSIIAVMAFLKELVFVISLFFKEHME